MATQPLNYPAEGDPVRIAGLAARPGAAQALNYTAMLAAPPSPQLALGLVLLVAELFVLQTRFFDFYLAGFHAPMIIFLALLAFVLFGLTSQMWNFNKRTTGLMVMGLGWLCVSTLFSTWRSNSVTQLTGYLYLSIVGLAIIIFVDTPARLVRVLTSFGLLYGCAALMGFFLGQPGMPRLELVSGTYSDPNIYGLSILAGIPIMWWLMGMPNQLVRLTALLLSFAMYWIILKTGSRGAFISLGIVILFALYHASPLRKVMMVVGLTLAIFMASTLLSTYAKKRLFTVFDSSVSEADAQSMSAAELSATGGDVGSSESRWKLLMDSLEITGRNPVVGVGPGNFGDARWKMHLDRVGRNIEAQTTHNTYTQLSSEGGLMALVIFLAQIFDALGNLKAVRKWNSSDGYRPPAVLVSAAHYLRFVLIAMCAGMFFLSLAYTGPFLIIVGLTLSLRNTVEKERNRYLAAQRAMTAATPAADLRQPAFGMR